MADLSNIPALSVRAPWWWFILYGGKGIENRDWPTNYRGPVLIHASKWFGARDVREDFEFAADVAQRAGVSMPEVSLADMKALGGHIVGYARVRACVQQSPSPWFFGRYGFVLDDARPLDRPMPCKGALGFFKPALPMEAPDGR